MRLMRRPQRAHALSNRVDQPRLRHEGRVGLKKDVVDRFTGIIEEDLDNAEAFVDGLEKCAVALLALAVGNRSEEHTSELQSLMRISYAVFCLKTKIVKHIHSTSTHIRLTDHKTTHIPIKL